MTMTDQEMENKLKETFPNAELAVVDLTGGQNHFEVRMNNSAFSEDLSRIEKHKKIMSLFDDQLKSGEVHALAIKLF